MQPPLVPDDHDPALRQLQEAMLDAEIDADGRRLDYWRALDRELMAQRRVARYLETRTPADRR